MNHHIPFCGIIPVLAALLTGVGFADNSPISQPYIWKSVQMSGGGFVDGIVFHPKQKDLYYARTDIGGAYRWDAQARQWIPLLDWLPLRDVNLMGVESIAVDPSDPRRLYLACGMYTSPTSPNAAILRSDDQGATFQRSDVPFKMGGNEDGRGNGERLAVDPNDGQVLYFGSRQAGLWRSTDRAVTWNKVDTFPDVTESRTAPTTAPFGRRFRLARSSGIVFVIFGPASGGAGKPSTTIYVGASLLNRDSLFRSTDAGRTWAAVPGQPTNLRPSHAALASNGVIYLSYGNAPGPSPMNDGAIWKFDTGSGQWTDITPEKPDPKNGNAFGYGAVSVDAQNPDALIASSFYHPSGEELFRSTDGGKSWKPIFRGGGTYDYSGAPYTIHTPIHWLLDIEIDPFNPDHAMFTTGYGGWETFNLRDADAGKPTHWTIFSRGIEETVGQVLVSPPAGAPLISGIGDYGGFVQWNLDQLAPEGNFDHPHFGNCTGIDVAQKDPNIIVRVGELSGNRAAGVSLGYSTDQGKTWQPAKTAPAPRSSGGSISVSADGSRWIWTPRGESPWLTSDQGATWTVCDGLDVGARTIADPINPMKFYSIDLFAGQMSESDDGGRTFHPRHFDLPDGLPKSGGDRGDARGGQDRIYATPEKEGDLWLAAFEGLYHSADAGHTFTKTPGPANLQAFGFGKAAPGAQTPALYLIGTIGQQEGIYRSDNYGNPWIRINDDQHQYGLLLQITGDSRIYGRVYVGTHGRGIVYGDPAN